jgi:hypothetical protein
MTACVSRLRIAENVCIEVEALTLLQESLGYDGSQDVIERAVVEVAERMGAVEQALMLGDLDGLRRSARMLGSIGEQLGFQALADVAQAAIDCAIAGNMNALHAVTERLIRIGDASLAAAIEGATLPG